MEGYCRPTSCMRKKRLHAKLQREKEEAPMRLQEPAEVSSAGRADRSWKQTIKVPGGNT